jgi:hypothetical protein
MLEMPVPSSSLHAGSTHSNLFLSSPSNRIVTSSSTRKHGVCGGTLPSLSDIEDWSTSDFPSSLQCRKILGNKMFLNINICRNDFFIGSTKLVISLYQISY